MKSDAHVALISTQGSGGVIYRLRELPPFTTRRSFQLLVYLVYNRGVVFPRERLASLFWPQIQPSLTRRRLRTEIWRVKQYFDKHLFDLSPYTVNGKNEFGLTEEVPVRLDMHPLLEMDRRLRDGQPLPDEPEQGWLLHHCNRDFLPYVYVPWAEGIREQLRQRYRNCMESLYQWHKRDGRWRSALDYARAILELDELDEHIHYEVMLCYLRCNMRSRAIRQYTECRRRLNQELGLTPVPVIEDLYREILRSDARSVG
ncbi:BTAD domain-containing putative transcriptional regulator [Microbulbifer sp. TYP-18]|uniref:AfsR/SARP family transcriptional regulator n=1 Tax=Microbulbifer sp. TYP-18 TaxID=3230024 RepID=UPI0034C6BE51